MRKLAIQSICCFLWLFSQAALVLGADKNCNGAEVWVDDAELIPFLKSERIKAQWGDHLLNLDANRSPGYSFSYNRPETAYFVTPVGKYSELIVLSKRPQKALRITVAEWKHRPLKAKWKSDRVLRLETSFSPRTGAYWEFDLLTEKILTKKFGYEDTKASRRCDE